MQKRTSPDGSADPGASRQRQPRKRKREYGLKQDGRGIWHCDFSSAGERVQRSTFTSDRKAAEEWCAKVASDIWREKKLGEAPALTFEQATVEWMKAKALEGKKDLAGDDDKRRLLVPIIGSVKLHDFTNDLVNSTLDELQEVREWANATRNRHLAFICGINNMALARGWRAAVLTIKRASEPTERVRWLTKDEARALMGQLPIHLNRMARFALATGIRQANVTGMLWRNVDLGRRIAWVLADDAKGKRNISVPLSDDAVAVLREAKDCADHGDRQFPFTYYGEPILQPSGAAWAKALDRAHIDDFRWHDLRHTWASWHVMGWWNAQGVSTPLPVLQKLGGWADIRMVMKYAHLAPDHTAQFVGNVGLQEPVAAAPTLRVVA